MEYYQDKARGKDFIFVVTDNAAYIKNSLEGVEYETSKAKVIYVNTMVFINVMCSNNLAENYGININPLHYDSLLQKQGHTPDRPITPLNKNKIAYNTFSELIHNNRHKTRELV